MTFDPTQNRTDELEAAAQYDRELAEYSDISEFAVLVDVPKVKDEPGDDAECDVVELPAAHARAMCAPGMQEGV